MGSPASRSFGSARDLGGIIRSARVAKGWTQADLGRRCGCSGSVVSRLETGQQPLENVDVLRRLADALGLKYETLGIAPVPRPASGTARGLIPRPRQAPVSYLGPPPAQLPADVRGFAGRGPELKRLDDALGQARQQPTAVVISAVSGTAGVGKTTVAVHWAHRHRGYFPDGQLYVDLHGYHPSGDAMAPADAIRRFLVALSVPPDHVPIDIDAQTGLYRSLLDGKRILVILDNARDAEHARPLLPGTAGCMAIVTSRNSLASLVSREGATSITLNLLSQDEARRLLTHRIGDDRVAAEPDAVDALITSCAHLPLALAIVAARAANHPSFPLATLAAELDTWPGRLDALAEHSPDVRAVFSWSYQTLTPHAARLFRLLGLHPGPDISVPAAASLAGTPIDQARSALAELSHGCLLTEHTPGRYRFHDLLRAYATELASDDGIDCDQRDVLRRMLDHYLHTAYLADRVLRPSRDPIGLPPASVGTSLVRLASGSQAMDWFVDEHQVLLAVLDRAVTLGLDDLLWRLVWSLDTFLTRQGHWLDGVTAWQAALAAAVRLGDQRAQALAHRTLGRAHTELGNYAEAHAHLREALDLCDVLGDIVNQGHAHGAIARVYERQQRYNDALSHVQQAHDLFRTAGHTIGQARVLNDLGWYQALMGHYREALQPCQDALALHQALNNDEGAADTLDSLGYIYHQLGDHDTAIAYYRRALDLFRGLGDRHLEATTLHRTADAHHSAGNDADAEDAWQQALNILDDLNHVDAATVRAKLRRSEM